MYPTLEESYQFYNENNNTTNAYPILQRSYMTEPEQSTGYYPQIQQDNDNNYENDSDGDTEIISVINIDEL
jgi:hypothetical protein